MPPKVLPNHHHHLIAELGDNFWSCFRILWWYVRRESAESVRWPWRWAAYWWDYSYFWPTECWPNINDKQWEISLKKQFGVLLSIDERDGRCSVGETSPKARICSMNRSFKFGLRNEQCTTFTGEAHYYSGGRLNSAIPKPLQIFSFSGHNSQPMTLKLCK